MPDRIGLFGGTFDPVHNGHISIAQSFLSSSYIDELWILLTPFPPHKDQEKPTSYSDRLHLLSLAFNDMDGVIISTIENELKKPSYTYRTIQTLKQKHPGKAFYFCMGEDSLSAFSSWKNYKLILNEVELLVAERPGADHSMVDKAILDRAHFVTHQPLDISSSQVRKFVLKEKPISDLVPQSVSTYILNQNMYKSLK
ncbi:MAG TPA: nicotinate (nicotinamide) nucleotide adenylyltransferase [Balneolaceae bacterium]|nr:nicotinate (nicotinamide) nucleotide adenylyltransferase [Balneolaceae bacterium]|tara:strand:+ start:150916 stop:151509 length:594 start_codon:yes stop_codon:yes gene_type:complete